jgi:hypothetical protein
VDLQNSGAGCYRSDTTGIVISLGLTPGSRRYPLLGRISAGAAHGSDSIDKLATLFPPFRTIRNKYGTECEACQGLFSVRLEQPSLIRPSATFSRWKKREKAHMIIALSRASSRERVPARLRPRGLWRAKKGRVRGVCKHLNRCDKQAELRTIRSPRDVDVQRAEYIQ